MPELISILDLDSLKAAEDSEIHAMYEDMVAGYVELLKTGAALQIGSSMAKDSTIILNGAVEAMRRAIKVGYIERDHPLVVTTIDTLLEPEPITCYVPFAHKQLKAYCAAEGINLILKIGSPPINKQLSVLFFGAMKLPATAASGRAADCSIIWKLDTARALLREVKQSLPKKHQELNWVSCSGSRSAESSRRSMNMQKQGVSELTAKALATQIIEADKAQVWRFAPIAEWSTPEVFSCLLRMGGDPMTKPITGKSIAGYAGNFGLLLNIYGEGANDTCDVATGKNGDTSCNGSARYGCVTCGMVNSENSSELQYRKEWRWGRFGDATSRLRDYVARVTSDVNARIYHPKAYDPAANNNVFLQPNVLHPRILEKLVWYAAQISEDSVKIAAQFKALVDQGRVMEDEGVQDIINDTSMSDKVKADYLEMYIARLQSPMWEMFTTKHAVLLSLLWSLHGVCALPYRPLKILELVRSGKRLPFPALNTELAEKGLFTRLTAPKIPDALVAQIFKPAASEDDMLPWDINEAWIKPDSVSELLGAGNCLLSNEAVHNRKVKATKLSGNEYKLVDMATSKVMNLEPGFIITYLADMSVGQSKTLTLPNQALFTSGIKGCRVNHVAGLPVRVRASARKRQWNKKASRYEVGRASLITYTPAVESNLSVQTTAEVSYYLPSYMMTTQRVLDIASDDIPAADAFEFDDFAFSEFESFGGLDELIQLHDKQLAYCLKYRVSTRKFTGTRPVFKLLNGLGLSVSDTNRRYVLAYIKRVEIFNNANLFELGLSKREVIEQVPFVVDMATHRSQKAQHLMAVRRARNINRLEAKAVMDAMKADPVNTALQRVTSRVMTFIQHDTQIRSAYRTAKLLNILGLIGEAKAEQFGFWLAQYGSVLSSMKEVLNLLATDAERKAIESNYPAMIGLANKIEQQVSQSRRKLTCVDEREALSYLETHVALTAKGAYQWLGKHGQSKATNLVSSWCSQIDALDWNLLEYNLQQVLAAASGLDRVDWQGRRQCKSWNENGKSKVLKAKVFLLEQSVDFGPSLTQDLVDNSSVSDTASLLAGKVKGSYLAQRRSIVQN
ncbi:hypothetical protein [Motilimonas eburnea]|uniref:hypothetical protein n=1 Tax=Motilimonas eburnea TaxID=1737488 RepID=UPI001E3CE3D6|nr:hypothetical protein [Motilimonas eburnea]MCE2571664.1 hypothetical protein [Motilimonas eburnea]